MLSALFKWFRPKDPEHAVLIKQRLALAYGVVGWHAFIYAFYLYIKEDLPLNTEERKTKIISTMISKGKNVEVVHLKGTQLEETTLLVDNLNAAS